MQFFLCVPTGIRTLVARMKILCPNLARRWGRNQIKLTKLLIGVPFARKNFKNITPERNATLCIAPFINEKFKNPYIALIRLIIFV